MTFILDSIQPITLEILSSVSYVILGADYAADDSKLPIISWSSFAPCTTYARDATLVDQKLEPWNCRA